MAQEYPVLNPIKPHFTWRKLPNGSISLNTFYKKSIKGRVCKELDDLVSALQNVVVVVVDDGRDRWRWTLFEDGKFKVKDLARMIEEKILHVGSGAQQMVWN
nr:reverse transcriptase domain, reverse transcriptase zinc-binding domain protein [Tanacetum cinerariifolium]